MARVIRWIDLVAMGKILRRSVSYGKQYSDLGIWLDELMVYIKSLELKESKYETSWLEDTIRSIALSIWRKVDHNSEF